MRWAATALGILLASAACAADDPFASNARARVLLFVRTDCPITNRYAPGIAAPLPGIQQPRRRVLAGLSRPEPSTAQPSSEHVAQYSLPGTVLRDPRHSSREARARHHRARSRGLRSAGKLLYHGRIDDRWVNPGTARPAARTHDLEDAIAAVLAGTSSRSSLRRPPWDARSPTSNEERCHRAIRYRCRRYRGRPSRTTSRRSFIRTARPAIVPAKPDPFRCSAIRT